MYIRLCQGDRIGTDIFVAITGPPEMKEIIVKNYQLSFFTNGAKGQCVKLLFEYTFRITLTKFYITA